MTASSLSSAADLETENEGLKLEVNGPHACDGRGGVPAGFFVSDRLVAPDTLQLRYPKTPTHCSQGSTNAEGER